MTNALALRDTETTMAEWGVIREQASMLVKTGFLPQSIKTAEQAMAIILTGRELGIGPMAALNNINVIQGKPTVAPQLMLALINRTGQLEEFTINDDGQCCTVLMKRRGRQPHVESFSMKDAALMKTSEYINGEKKTISLSEKYNWKQQPATMRKWRAVAACARVVFADVILGLYIPDEMGADSDEEGAIRIVHNTEPTAANIKREYPDLKPVETKMEPADKERNDLYENLKVMWPQGRVELFDRQWAIWANLSTEKIKESFKGMKVAQIRNEMVKFANLLERAEAGGEIVDAEVTEADEKILDTLDAIHAEIGKCQSFGVADEDIQSVIGPLPLEQQDSNALATVLMTLQQVADTAKKAQKK